MVRKEYKEKVKMQNSKLFVKQISKMMRQNLVTKIN